MQKLKGLVFFAYFEILLLSFAFLAFKFIYLSYLIMAHSYYVLH
jgi:hypothetical protein